MGKAVTSLADWITGGIKGHAESRAENGLPDEVIIASVSRKAGQEFSEAIDRVRRETEVQVGVPDHLLFGPFGYSIFAYGVSAQPL
jgi:hypothetical protein